MINRQLWTEPFLTNNFPPWKCGKCGVGILENQKDNFYYIEDADTLAFKQEVFFDYEYTKYRFSAILKCNYKDCMETSILTGWGCVDIRDEINEYTNEHEQKCYKYFYPEYCNPPPAVFVPPFSVPEPINKYLLSSFAIFFSDFHGAANKLRICLELILLEEGIPQTNKCYKLETRLKELCIKHTLDTHEFYDVIQKIGDEGAHGGLINHPLTINNILDGYELLDYLLDELYLEKPRKDRLIKITKKYPKKNN